jgi:hypothetical protein
MWRWRLAEGPRVRCCSCRSQPCSTPARHKVQLRIISLLPNSLYTFTKLMWKVKTGHYKL